MSIRSLLDIVVHIENFRNIDLFYQGIYFLRFRVYSEIDNKKVMAHPYIISENYKPYPQDSANAIKGNKIMDNQIFQQAQIVDKTSAFLTKQFIIKFCEEEVELNDICHFRIEIDTKPGFDKTEICMDADLVFIDQYTNQFGYDKSQEPQVSDPNLPEKSKVLATSRYVIREAFKGVHEFIPVLFEDQNFCVANVMFHSLLQDYRFRICPMQLSEFAQVKQEERLALVEGGAKLNIQNNGKNKDEKVLMNQYIQTQFKGIDYENMYKIFVEELKKSYEILYNHYHYINQKCILEKQRKTFKKYLQPPMKLIIPEYVTSENVREVSKAKDFNTKILEKFRTKDPEAITHAILNEANLISGQLIQLWHKYLDLYKISPRFCSAVLQHQYYRILKEKYQFYIEKQNKVDHDMFLAQHKNIFEQRNNNAKKMRKILQQEKFLYPNQKIQYNGFFPQAENAPILFEEFTPIIEPPSLNEENIIDQDSTSCDDSLENGYYRGIHLFVLVHGFQGNSFDMKLLKNYLNYLHPESMFLCSSINEESTEGDIDEMGQKLANEVSTFIYDNCPGNTLGRISFIGHSLGGVIIRSGLRFLEDFKDKMFTFMSLSSPHVGYQYNSSKIIDAGLWFLKRWKKSLSLQQLSVQDKERVQDCFLYKLSQSHCLKWFKNVVLLSSQQDQYVPFESARIEIGQSAQTDPEKGKFYIEMAKNILKDIPPSSLFRMEVNFHIQEKNIDTFIGRAAHILFLECTPLIRMLVHNYETFFN